MCMYVDRHMNAMYVNMHVRVNVGLMGVRPYVCVYTFSQSFTMYTCVVTLRIKGDVRFD